VVVTGHNTARIARHGARITGQQARQPSLDWITLAAQWRKRRAGLARWWSGRPLLPLTDSGTSRCNTGWRPCCRAWIRQSTASPSGAGGIGKASA